MKSVDSRKLLENLSFTAIDLETTGGNHQHDQIFEIGLVKIERLEIVKELHYLINPERKIPPFVQRLTSVSIEDLTDAPKIADVIDELVDFIGDSIVVAHNISFDLPFFNSVLKRLKRPELGNSSLCTHLMSQHLIPNILSSNLHYMSQLFDIPHDRAHRALDDARACALLLLNFLDVFIERGVHKVNQLYYPQAKFKLNKAHFSVDQRSQFFATVQRIHSSAIVRFKGNEGALLATLPVQDLSQEREIVDTVMEMIDVRSISMELVGSFFEAFLAYNTHYSKMEGGINKCVFDYLKRRHLGGMELPFDAKDYAMGIDPQNFLLAHHLIPGQLSLYPLFNLQINDHFLFRYPDHKKRLYHYATGHLRQSKRRRRHCIHQNLFPFLQQYLHRARAEKCKHYLFLNKSVFSGGSVQFTRSVQRFCQSGQQKNGYPKRHL